MKGRYKVIAALMMSVMMLGGCGSSDVSYQGMTTEKAKEYTTLGEYEGIALTKYISEFSEEDVAYKQEEFMEEYRVQAEVSDRAIKEGDFVSIELTETVEGGEPEEYGVVETTVGSEEIDGKLDAGLLGHNTGETVTIDSSILQEDGSEAKVTYTVKINTIYEVSYPEYNDAFVKENTEYATVAELEAFFRSEVEADNEEMSQDNLRESAITAVVEASEFKELPQDLVDSAYEEVKEMYESYAAMFGMELSDMASEEDLQEAARYSVQEQMVIQCIIDKENIKIDKDGFSEYKKLCMEYTDVETEEELMEYYEESELEAEYLRQKAADAIIAKATVTEEVGEEEDYYEEEEVTAEAPEVDENVVIEEEAAEEE